MKVRALLAASLLSCSLSLSAATEVIPLNFRTADEVLSVVQSVLGHKGKVNAYGNQLIVNAEPAKIAEVRALLQQLDTEPRRLLISVDTNESGFQSDRGYRADGTISAGDAEVQIGQAKSMVATRYASSAAAPIAAAAAPSRYRPPRATRR